MSHFLSSVVAAAAVAAVAAAVLPAQALSLPTKADIADCHESLSMPFGVSGFRTQILVDGASISSGGAVLSGLRFRADRPSLPLVGGTVPNVTITMSHTSLAIGALQTTFAQNITGTQTTVFQGTVTLPAYTSGFAGPLPWDIAIQFPQPYTFTTATGNLLIDIVGNNPAGAFPNYWLDATQPGGSATRYGTGGDNPTFDNLNLIVSTGGFLEPRFIAPGHSIEYTSTLSFTQPPGVLALGTTGFPAPIDLGPIGAPTNSLYLDPIVLATHSWTQSFIGWYSTFSLAVPAVPAFVGITIYAQSAIFEPTANPLGLVLSHAVETLLGDTNEFLPLQQVNATDPAAATGTIVDFGFAQPQHGAVPVRLEGVFF